MQRTQRSQRSREILDEGQQPKFSSLSYPSFVRFIFLRFFVVQIVSPCVISLLLCVSAFDPSLSSPLCALCAALCALCLKPSSLLRVDAALGGGHTWRCQGIVTARG